MKTTIANLLTWILSKMKVSVIIGCKVKGDLTLNENAQFFYGNDFTETKLHFKNGQGFNLPEGKFSIYYEHDEKTDVYTDKVIKIKQ